MLDTMFNRSSWSTRSSSVCPDLRPRDHVTSTLISLHWLPIRQRITYKLCTIMHSVFHGLALLYISNIVTPVTHLPGRAHLRSAKNDDNTPRVLSGFGQRSFSMSGPDAWNRVSRELKGIAVASTFKRHLKAELFSRAWLTHPSSAVYS